jgi:predicted NBD/HSP70 family sugar kinase
MSIAWGIDLGGTKIECVVLEVKKDNNFEVICRKRIPTDAYKGYQHILSQISLLLRQVEQEIRHKPMKLGIGTPGIMDTESQQIKNANVVCINKQNLPKDLSEMLHIPVFHANDANCFALAETCLGAGAALTLPPKLAFGIILGTGVGGGLVINNQIHQGSNGIAGEWGHNPLIPNSQNCYCGRNGCVETVISGPALENYYFLRTAQKLRLDEIYQNHLTENDTTASATIIHLLHNFGKALAQLINILDPDLIVLGGGVSNLDVLYEDIEQYILPHLFNQTLNTPILKNKLGDSAGVIGAALLSV